MKHIPSLSYGIVCRNSLKELKQTLRINLANNSSDSGFVDFILFDFGSADGTKDWVKSHFEDELNAGYLHYYFTGEMSEWNLPRAKNCLYYWSRKDIVVNLMADYFTGENEGRSFIHLFMDSSMNLFCNCKTKTLTENYYSKLAVLREDFDRLGGYDEELISDMHITDFIARLEFLGLETLFIEDLSYSQLSVSSMEFDTCYDDLFSLERQRAISDRNTGNGRLVANNRKYGIRSDVYDINGKLLIR